MDEECFSNKCTKEKMHQKVFLIIIVYEPQLPTSFLYAETKLSRHLDSI